MELYYPPTELSLTQAFCPYEIVDDANEKRIRSIAPGSVTTGHKAVVIWLPSGELAQVTYGVCLSTRNEHSMHLLLQATLRSYDEDSRPGFSFFPLGGDISEEGISLSWNVAAWGIRSLPPDFVTPIVNACSAFSCMIPSDPIQTLKGPNNFGLLRNRA